MTATPGPWALRGRQLAEEWAAWMRHLRRQVEPLAGGEPLAFFIHTSKAHLMGQILLGICGVDADPLAQVQIGEGGVLGYFEGLPVIVRATCPPHTLRLTRRAQPDPAWLARGGRA